MSFYLVGGRNNGRANKGHHFLPAVYRVFETKDGHLVVAGVAGRELPGFLRALDLTHLTDDPRFAGPAGLAGDLPAAFAILEPAFRTRTTAEWCERLRAEKQRFAPVNDYAAIAEYEQAYANGYLRRIEHPQWGAMTQVGSPIDMSATPANPGVTAPELGEHTEEVLIESGYTWEDIGALREAGAI
jgi:crotonobetainyl-CoA:carnitine CoA-transferase CaiB-like acyl-CoA transferase